MNVIFLLIYIVFYHFLDFYVNKYDINNILYYFLHIIQAKIANIAKLIFIIGMEHASTQSTKSGDLSLHFLIQPCQFAPKSVLQAALASAGLLSLIYLH